MILTLDFGTTVTKVGVWGDAGLATLAPLGAGNLAPQLGWTEQDPLRLVGPWPDGLAAEGRGAGVA